MKNKDRFESLFAKTHYLIQNQLFGVTTVVLDFVSEKILQCDWSRGYNFE